LGLLVVCTVSSLFLTGRAFVFSFTPPFPPFRRLFVPCFSQHPPIRNPPNPPVRFGAGAPGHVRLFSTRDPLPRRCWPVQPLFPPPPFSPSPFDFPILGTVPPVPFVDVFFPLSAYPFEPTSPSLCSGGIFPFPTLVLFPAVL